MPETATETAGTPTSSPAPAPSSAPAAPSSAPAPAPAAPSSPATAAEAVERAAKTMESASATGSPQPATQPPGATSGTQEGLTSTGQIFHLPKTKEDYDRILSNARQKTERELRDKLGWAEQYDPEGVREATQLLEQFRANPTEFARQILAEQQQEEELVDPEPDYTGPDGKGKFYSQATLDKRLSNLEQRLTRQFRPALNMVEQAEQQQHINAITKDANEIANQAMAEIKKYPHFDKYKGDIAAKFQAIPPDFRRRVGSVAALHMAYQAVVNEKQQEIRGETEKSVRNEFLRKANHVGDVQPGDQSTARKPVRDGDVDGLASRMRELADNMGVR